MGLQPKTAELLACQQIRKAAWPDWRRPTEQVQRSWVLSGVAAELQAVVLVVAGVVVPAEGQVEVLMEVSVAASK